MGIRQISYEEIEDLPDIVYKYRTWSDNLHKEIISKQIVFMAKPTSFEDLLDCKLQKRYDLLTDDDIYNHYLIDSQKNNLHLTDDEHNKYASNCFVKSPMRDKEYVKHHQEKHFAEFDNRFGVLSLTSNPKLNKMWDKYADRHQGFCVGFDTKKMFKNLGGGGPVCYYDILPDILPFDAYEVEHFKQVFSKEEKWALEEEYRTHRFYPSPANIEDRRIKLPKDCFKQVIFGANQAEKDRHEIISICNGEGLDVEFYNAIINKQEITIEKMNS